MLSQSRLYEDALRELDLAISANSNKPAYYDLRGYCLESLKRYDEAIQAFNHALMLDSHNAYAQRHVKTCNESAKINGQTAPSFRPSLSLTPAGQGDDRWLGYTLKDLDRYAQETKSSQEDEFKKQYWSGIELLRARKFDEAARILAKAVDLKPEDFNANFWRGMSLVRARKFTEAVPSFEKAHEIKVDDRAARFELFACYLASSQPEKANHLYPHLIITIGGALALLYCLWLAALLPFSLPVRAKLFPGLLFSLAWLGLFVEGQIACLLILASLPWLGLHETVLAGTAVAGLPIIAVALTGFARQPWGEPFRWPPRFGSPKIILISVLLIFVTVLIASGFSQLYVHVTNKPFPLQRTIPLIRKALQANPVAAWLGIAFIIPCVEEILFRGLLFGAFQKMWGVTGAILASSFLFVCVHLQIVGFLALFLLGMILAWARLRSGSLGLPIILHSLNNAIAMAVLTFGPPATTS